MTEWQVLLDVLILLAAALVLGAVCERLRQSAIVGYLAAGALVGPHALSWIHSGTDVGVIAELGVALLLFSIGLEFSWKRLRLLGRAALAGGAAQVVATTALAGAAALLFGLPARVALACGAIVALSSTASVLRLLAARAEVESVHGRHALGILLVQDLAVVPLVLLVTVLGGDGSIGAALVDVATTLLVAVLLVAVMYLLFTRVVPRLLSLDAVRRNRDLPILLATVTGLGSAWGAHALGLSPALGAFAAGMLLAESPFALQIRTDVGSLRILLVTLFFSSIGLYADPQWFFSNLPAVLGLVAAVVIGKAVLIWLILRLFGLRHEHALATGLCLAQVGEFSFVLLAQARGGLLGEELFALLISATIATLFLTPFLVEYAPRMAALGVRLLQRLPWVSEQPAEAAADRAAERPRIVVIGFGPAGQAVGASLVRAADRVIVLDLNPALLERARRMGFSTHVGDAMQAEALLHLGIGAAAAAVVTIPDPAAVRSIIGTIRELAPEVPVIARGRYHRFMPELLALGSDDVVDEEHLVGTRLAALLRKRIGSDLLGSSSAPKEPDELG